MGDKSHIEWTDASWTPVRARVWQIQDDGSGKERIGWHCEHVSEGCRNCYAESINQRLGTGLDFKPGNRRGRPGYYGGGTDRAEVFLDDKMLTQPLRWRKSRRIFVCSMTDLFADFVLDEWIDRIFAVMALCPQHVFQVLTKRPERMREYCERGRPETIERLVRLKGTGDIADRAVWRALNSISEADLLQWPLPNCWKGTSVEDQKRADERIPLLLATPAAVRWVSYEPALGPVDFRPWLYGAPKLNWIVVGGES